MREYTCLVVREAVCLFCVCVGAEERADAEEGIFCPSTLVHTIQHNPQNTFTH